MSEVQKIPAVPHRKQRDRDMVGAPDESNFGEDSHRDRRPGRFKISIHRDASDRVSLPLSVSESWSKLLSFEHLMREPRDQENLAKGRCSSIEGGQ